MEVYRPSSCVRRCDSVTFVFVEMLWLLYPGLFREQAPIWALGTMLPVSWWSSSNFLHSLGWGIGKPTSRGGSFWFSIGYLLSVLPRAGDWQSFISPEPRDSPEDFIVVYITFPQWLMRLAPFCLFGCLDVQ